MNYCRVFLLSLVSYLVYAHQSDEHAHLANAWYPGSAQLLSDKLADLDSYAREHYDAAIDPITVRAVIAPHAGIIYSGAIAASVFRFVNPNTKRVIILAPDHSGSTVGVSLPMFSRYIMSNGTLLVDTGIIKELETLPHFKPHTSIFASEHSLEMELPFIARYLKKATIVPLIVGRITCDHADEIAQSLKPYIDTTTLVIVSSDFVHYGKRFNFMPFYDHQKLRIRYLDSQAIQLIGKGKCVPFNDFLEKTHATICGVNPLKILLELIDGRAFGAVESRLISYATSGKTDQDESVSYVGMLFTTQLNADLAFNQKLTMQEKRNLYMQASDILAHMFDLNFNVRLYDPILSSGVMQPFGAFTTLRTQNGVLRGCIGRIVSNDPLYKTVATVTQDAAIRDSRFRPVTQAEAPTLDLKLSILERPHPILSYKQIEIGSHGIILECDGKSAVFLPDVPLEFKWTRDQTLTQLAQKAGLAPQDWRKKDAHFEVFTAFGVGKE